LIRPYLRAGFCPHLFFSCVGRFLPPSRSGWRRTRIFALASSRTRNAHDEEAYPIARFLSLVFIYLAIFTAFSEIFGLIYYYQWGKLIFSQRELFLAMFSLAVASAGSVVMLLAISEGLKMGRDAANHARAMREYLRKVAGK
jgi:hypothetical protein